MPSQGRKHILSRLPLRQGSLPKSKGTLGNNFSRRICQWRFQPRSSSKTPLSWKKNRTLEKKIQKKFRVEKWKLANRLKRVFPKFRADRSHVRGVNGRLKFRFFFRRAAGRIFFLSGTARHGAGRGGSAGKKEWRRGWVFFFTTLGLFWNFGFACDYTDSTRDKKKNLIVACLLSVWLPHCLHVCR